MSVMASALPVRATAQSRDASVRSMVHQALDDAQNGDAEAAENRLRLALRACTGNHCSSRVAAQAHVAMGEVLAVARNDRNGAQHEFAEALRLDASAQLDDAFANDTARAAFRQANGGAPASEGNAAGTEGSTTESAPAAEIPAIAGPSLLHTPAPEQLDHTPLPVYVELPASVRTTNLSVFYRTQGSSDFASVALGRIGHGFGSEIPCAAVTSPGVEYFVVAQNANGRTIGHVGAPDAPVMVAVVSSRSRPAPALPGRMPSQQCASAHAATGGHSGGNLGDACSQDSECGSGMHCSEGACASGGASAASEPSSSSSSSDGLPEYYRFAIDAGGGVALPFLAAGSPRYEEYREWDMPGSGNFTCGMTNQLNCPPVTSAGFGYEGIVAFGVRVNVARRVGLQAYLRYQPDSASVGIIPSLFFGARVLVALNSNGFVKRGFSGALFMGTGFGQMQATPPGASAHIVSGLNNFNAGGRIEYGFGVIHIGAEIALNFQFPNFLFVPDVTAFAGVHF